MTTIGDEKCLGSLTERQVDDLSRFHSEQLQPSHSRALNRKNSKHPVFHDKGFETNIDNVVHFDFPPSFNDVIIT